MSDMGLVAFGVAGICPRTITFLLIATTVTQGLMVSEMLPRKMLIIETMLFTTGGQIIFMRAKAVTITSLTIILGTALPLIKMYVSGLLIPAKESNHLSLLVNIMWKEITWMVQMKFLKTTG